MRTTPAAVLFALASTALANFDVYYKLSGGNGIGANIQSYGFFNDDPSCKEARNNVIWPVKRDLSSELGVRCKGKSKACTGNSSPSGIEEMEIRINREGYHWTIYRDRGWGLFDTDDNQVGDCYPFPAHGYDSTIPNLGQIRGERIFRCETSITATDIEENEGWGR